MNAEQLFSVFGQNNYTFHNSKQGKKKTIKKKIEFTKFKKRLKLRSDSLLVYI